jgi:chlorite dismutase
MRFDEASAVYGLFGSFFVGLRFPSSQFGALLEGKTPAFA